MMEGSASDYSDDVYTVNRFFHTHFIIIYIYTEGLCSSHIHCLGASECTCVTVRLIV